MALNLKLSNATVNAEADAHSALLNSGYLRIYDGTQPTNADTAIGAQVLLAELRFGATAFAAASAGVAAANAITSDSSANATGTATWYRTLKSDGTTVVSDGSVGTSGANLNLNSVAITAGAAVDCTAFVFTQPKS
jgi:predicted amidohydrolase YtcJ